MRVRVDDPSATGDLGDFLRRQAGAIVDRREPCELEVCLVGSFNDTAMRQEIEHSVRHWSIDQHRRTLVVVG